MLAQVRALMGQSAIYGLGNLLTQGIRFLLLPFYTRFLTPADFGILSIANTFDAVMDVFLQFGLGGAVVRFHYDFLNDEEKRRAYYGTIWIFLTLGALSLCLITDWRGEVLFHLLFPGVPFRPYGQLALWSSFLTVPSMIPLVLFRVREQAFSYVSFTVSRFLLTTIAIIFFVAYLKQGALGSLRGQLLATALLAVPFTIVTLRNLRWTVHWDQLRSSLAFGLPMIPHQLSAWALSLSDRILLARYVSLHQLGLYTLGYRFGMIMEAILQAVNLAWSPFFYRAATTEKDAPRTLARLTTYYVIGVLLLSLSLSLLSRDVIALMASPAFHEAHRIVPVVTLGFLCHGIYYMLVKQLFYAKQTALLSAFTLLSALVNIGLNILTIPRFGIMAAAWNTVIGYLLLLLLVFRQSNRAYPIPFEYRRLGILFLTAGVLYLVGSAMELGNYYLNLMARLLVIGAFPLALFALRFFSPREISGIRLLLSSAKRAQ